MDELSTDVVVVGGGLAGLATAMFLAHQGVPAVLLDRHPDTSTQPRARGVNPRTMELLRGLGLEQAVRSTPSGRALAGNSGIIAVESLAGRDLGALQAQYLMDPRQRPAESPCSWCLCDQNELEPIIRETAEKLGADVRFGVEAVDLEQDAEGVVVRARRAAARTGSDPATAPIATPGSDVPADLVVRARWLVAADGAASPIRRRLGIGTHGVGTLAHYMNIHYEAALGAVLGDRRFILCYAVNPVVRGALIPIDNDRQWLLHVPFVPGANPDAFSDEDCVRLVRAATGLPELDVTIRGVQPWEAAGRVADRLRDGRVLLVGDSAHVMPPTGAFGSNTGIQDAHALAWRLAAVLSGRGGDRMLDAYAAERLGVAERTVEQAVLRSKDRPRLVGEAPPERNPLLVADSVVMFGQRYPTAGDPGGWSPDPRGVPGTRAPHVPLVRDGVTVSTVDLVGREPVLLAGPGWEDADVLVHGIGGHTGAFGLEAGGAVLIRPDGVVAARWVTRPADPAAAVRDALDAL